MLFFSQNKEYHKKMSNIAIQYNYLSLYPTETTIWTKVQQQDGLLKVVAMIAALVLVPFEWLGRLFYNLAMGLLSLCSRGGISTPLPIASPTPISAVSQISLQDRVQGALQGQSIGDALGVFTEFLTRDQAAAARVALGRDDLEFSSRSFFLPREQGRHLSAFPVDGWTDDSDQAMMIPRAVRSASRSGSSSESLFAGQLLNWIYHGLNGYSGVQGDTFISRQDPSSSDPNRSQIRAAGLGQLVSAVTRNQNFSTNPHRAALEEWKTMSYAPTVSDRGLMHFRPAPNGAVMRTSPIGSMYRSDNARVVAEAIRFAKVTHADPRCLASCVAVSLAIALLQNGVAVPQVLRLAEDAAVQTLTTEMVQIAPHLDPREQGRVPELTERYKQELQQFLRADLSQLQLGEGMIGYTYKCMGAGFYALRKAYESSQQGGQPTSAIFRRVLQDVIWQGGDADTNAAVAGAMVGAFVGVNGIPDSWKQGLHPQDRALLAETNQLIHQISASG